MRTPKTGTKQDLLYRALARNRGYLFRNAVLAERFGMSPSAVKVVIWRLRHCYGVPVVTTGHQGYTLPTTRARRTSDAVAKTRENLA